MFGNLTNLLLIMVLIETNYMLTKMNYSILEYTAISIDRHDHIKTMKLIILKHLQEKLIYGYNSRFIRIV